MSNTKQPNIKQEIIEEAIIEYNKWGEAPQHILEGIVRSILSSAIEEIKKKILNSILNQKKCVFLDIQKDFIKDIISESAKKQNGKYYEPKH